MPLHFAYGSNADPDAFAVRCGFRPARAPLSIAGLSGFRLVFRRGGLEGLEPAPALSVWGAVYDVTEPELTKLEEIAAHAAQPQQQAGGPPDASIDVPPVPRRETVTVRIRTPDGTSVSRVGAAALVNDENAEVLAHRLTPPVPDVVRSTEDQLKAVLAAALRCDLPAFYIAALCDGTNVAPRLTVSDILPGKPDNTGVWILKVYAKAEPFFAVYSTDLDSVLVHYADDALIAQRQRETLAPLSSLRGRIYGLMERWREPGPVRQWLGARLLSLMGQRTEDRASQRTEDVNVRVAAALSEALTGSTKADVELQEIHDDLLGKRISAARLEYVAWASLFATVGTVIFLLMRRYGWPFDAQKQFLWLAAAGGIIGAFFSIAIAIRGRTVAIALARWDNRIDAILRVAVGAIAAGALLLILQTKSGGDTGVGGSKGFADNLTWQVIALIGFAAGFTERLVPDLLARGSANSTAGTTR
jgi:hypothetical protein